MTRRPVVLALALAAAPLAAQESSPPSPEVVRVSLADALARAREQAPRLRATAGLERMAVSDERAARAQRLPQADLQAGYTRRSHVPELFIPNDPPIVIFPDLPDNWKLRVGGHLPLYTGGRLERLSDAARSDVTAAGHDSEAASDELAWETAAAYWGLVTARDGERVLGEALASYDKHLNDARNRFNFGLAARNEVLAIEVDRNRADFLRIEAANLAASAEANLVRLLGLAAGVRVEAVESLEAATVVPELEPLVALALTHRADRSALVARIEAADARSRAESGARLPQVALVGGFEYANPNLRILPPREAWQTSWDIGVSVSLAVLDGGRIGAARARAEARRDVLREQLTDLDRGVRLEVTRARLDLDSALARLRVATQGQEAARENLRVAADRHREGVSPSAERLDAQSQLLRANLDHTHALAAVRLADAAILRATGAGGEAGAEATASR